MAVSYFFIYFTPDSEAQWRGRVTAEALCGGRLIGKIEALCSFLQAENLGNFQPLQRMFGEARYRDALKQIKTDIAASRIMRGTALLKPSYLFGQFLGPSV